MTCFIKISCNELETGGCTGVEVAIGAASGASRASVGLLPPEVEEVAPMRAAGGEISCATPWRHCRTLVPRQTAAILVTAASQTPIHCRILEPRQNAAIVVAAVGVERRSEAISLYSCNCYCTRCCRLMADDGGPQDADCSQSCALVPLGSLNLKAASRAGRQV